MKSIKTLLLGLIFSGFLWQCEDVDTIISETPAPTTSEKLNALFDEALTSEKMYAHFNSSNPNFVFTTPKGTNVTINGTCLRLDGLQLQGL